VRLTGNAPMVTETELSEAPEPKAKIFLSYSREDMAFADQLEAALKARGFQPLIDRTEIYAFEDWWKRIQDLISGADTVIFALSPEAVTSEVCAKEVAYAASLNKRFAPIVCRRVPDSAVPDTLRQLNFVFFDDPAQFEASADRLAEALRTDIGWIRQHTEYGENARHWAAAGRPGGLLLRSPALEDAEHWIASRPPTAPAPTDDTRTFITESRRGATRRRSILTGSLTAGLIVASALGGLAYWQWGIAAEQRHVAETNFRIARESTDSMIAGTGSGLRNLQKIDIATVTIVLSALNTAIDPLKQQYPNNQLIDLSRAEVGYEFAKTYQAAADRNLAFQEATKSHQILSSITNRSSPGKFEVAPGEWRWELSKSIELLGDLHREESKSPSLQVDERKRHQDDARKLFQDSLGIRQQLIQTSDNKKDKMDDYALGISQSFVRLGDLSKEANDLQTAQKYYDLSLKNAATFFSSNEASPKWQRELSYNLNKAGDIRLQIGQRDTDNSALKNEAVAALGHFKNSLCLRRDLVRKEPGNTLLKRDNLYTLMRIGDTNLLLEKNSEAEAAYFESLVITLELRDNDPKDARYVDDIIKVLEKIGDIYRSKDSQKALAYFEYALDVSSKFLAQTPNKAEAEIKLKEAQKMVQSIRVQLDQNTLDGLRGLWWHTLVEGAAEEAAKSQIALEQDATDCRDAVNASVEQIIRP
jgi:hypothetical protein